MNYKSFILALESIESDRNIDKEVVIESLREALEKAYRKHIDNPDALVDVVFNDSDGSIDIFQKFEVVEEVEDDDIQIELSEVSKINPNLEIGDFYYIKGSIDDLSRPAAILAKNVLKQKIREAEKQGVYDEYITQLGDLITASIETIEEKFIIVNLGKTLALMPKAAQIPNEIYKEGQKIKVIISEVNRDTKGAQVLVSRADEQLVRRLFEREVPEIFQGIVEIKGIAREAGDRTKVAVYSKNENIDALGSCIGPGGSRVHEIIDELKGEKIDVFEWSDDITLLVKNALAPAKVLSVIPNINNKNVLVVVDEDQLSLAIGKKGKNARLAVKLTNKKIDIKTPSALAELGIDYKKEYEQYLNRVEEEKIVAKLLADSKAKEQEEAKEAIIEEVIDIEDDTIITDDVLSSNEILEETNTVVDKPKRERKERVVSNYVSKFEKLADITKAPEQTTKKRYRRDKDEDDRDRKLSDLELRKEKEYEIKPEYSEEELEEIRLSQEVDTSWEDEIDYDDYEDFYE